MDILSKINFREYVGKHLKTAQVHQACMGLVTPEEIRSINQYLTQKNKEDGVAEVQHGRDIIDMDDLIDAIQRKHDFDATKKQSFGVVQNIDNSTGIEIEAMQRKIARILREKDDDAEFFSSKIRQLKRNLKEANEEKAEL